MKQDSLVLKTESKKMEEVVQYSDVKCSLYPVQLSANTFIRHLVSLTLIPPGPTLHTRIEETGKSKGPSHAAGVKSLFVRSPSLGIKLE